MARALRKNTATEQTLAEIDALLVYACHAIARKRAKREPEAALWTEIDELLDARRVLMLESQLSRY